MIFYWLTPFVDSFLNSDWFELVINFFILTNKQVNKMFSRSTFQITAIYDEVLRRVCATFRIETFQGEQQKAIDMFFDVSVSLPTGYEKSLLYQVALVISRLFSLEESGHYIYCVARSNYHRRPSALS